MKTFGTGMRFRRDAVVWPEPAPEADMTPMAEALPPFHTCEIPADMYLMRERLAAKWAGREVTQLVPPAPVKKSKPRKRKAA